MTKPIQEGEECERGNRIIRHMSLRDIPEGVDRKVVSVNLIPFERRLPHLTQATLSKQLKGLEASGLVVRKEYHQLPPKVEYSLSSIGQRFQVVLDSLETWGHEYMAYMAERQQK